MKLIIFTIFLFIGGGYCNDQTTRQSKYSDIKLLAFINFKSIFDALFKDKCAKNLENGLDRYREIVKSTVECIGRRFLNRSSEDQHEYQTNDIRDCSRYFIIFTKDCCEPEQKYIPEFAFTAVINLLCMHDDLLNINEIETQTCITNVGKDGAFPHYCTNKVSPPTLNLEPTKPELCFDLKTLYNCFDELIERICPENQQLRKVLAAVHQALISPCNKNQESKYNCIL